jgi:hypothetical protein
VPVPRLTHLEATAIQVIRLQTCDNPCALPFAFRPNVRGGHDCVRRGITGLDAWRRQRRTRGLELATEIERGKLLYDYVDENSRLISAPDSPNDNPYNLSYPDVSDIVITNSLSFVIYLTSYSALSSDHLPVLIGTACRSSLLLPLDRPDLKLH